MTFCILFLESFQRLLLQYEKCTKLAFLGENGKTSELFILITLNEEKNSSLIMQVLRKVNMEVWWRIRTKEFSWNKEPWMRFSLSANSRRPSMHVSCSKIFLYIKIFIYLWRQQLISIPNKYKDACYRGLPQSHEVFKYSMEKKMGHIKMI